MGRAASNTMYVLPRVPMLTLVRSRAISEILFVFPNMCSVERVHPQRIIVTTAGLKKGKHGKPWQTSPVVKK